MKKIIFSVLMFCFTFAFSQKNQNYLTVSYSSICCGTPSTNPVMNFVQQFKKKNKTKSFEILQQSGLGREGEFNLYIGIDQLSKTKKAMFIKGLEAAISSQNKNRNTGSDGYVNFQKSENATKADLSQIKNLTIYKYNLTK